MKPQIQNSRFDEEETVRLIANFGVKVSPETWNDLQSFLKGQKEEFLTQERQRENSRQRPGRSL
jgi:hypothetical protein